MNPNLARISPRQGPCASATISNMYVWQHIIVLHKKDGTIGLQNYGTGHSVIVNSIPDHLFAQEPM